ncbi:hypothetical protein C8R42DRAFT_715123 [Lentinula raphanica]|nr:hypothetical protein C8R42DRAFT_715123 [Lentinula raphanica]
MFQLSSGPCVFRTSNPSWSTARSSWAYVPPRGIALRTGIGASVILNTYGHVFHLRFSCTSSYLCWTWKFMLGMRSTNSGIEVGNTVQDSSLESKRSCSDFEAPSNYDSPHTLSSHYFRDPLELSPYGSYSYADLDGSLSVRTMVDVGIQTESHFHHDERQARSWTVPTQTTPSDASLGSVDEFIENDIHSSDIPISPDRTRTQNSALIDLLEFAILPTYLKDQAQTDEERLEFTDRMGGILNDYKPLTPAVFLALFYLEKLTSRIETMHSFYWWFILCLLYAHQTLDDFHTINITHVEHFMNVDASFAQQRQRSGYKALQYHLNISQVDWVYFLNHIRIIIEGLPLDSAEAMLQLISQSLPTPSQSFEDELLNPLHALNCAIEQDGEDIRWARENAQVSYRE